MFAYQMTKKMSKREVNWSKKCLKAGQCYCILELEVGQPGWLSSLAPPSAQGLILETRDRVPRWAHCRELLLPLPLSLSVSHE